MLYLTLYITITLTDSLLRFSFSCSPPSYSLFLLPSSFFHVLLPHHTSSFYLCFLLFFLNPFSFLLLLTFTKLPYSSPLLPSTSNSIAMNEVPAAWTAVAYPSMKPCSAWSEELLDRLQFIQGDSFT